MAAAIRPFGMRDAAAAADVLLVSSWARAAAVGRPAELPVPAAARRYVERLLEVDPLTAYVAEADGEVVGIGWTHPRGRIATVGPLAVLPEHRGQGTGRRLLEHCVASVGDRNVQVRMLEDASDAAALGLALRAGFRVVTSVLELERAADAGPVAEPPPGVVHRPAVASDEAELVARDSRSWGGPREQDVTALLAAGTGVLLTRHDRVLAHALVRRGERAVWLGPAAGDDGALVAAALSHLAAEAAREGLPARTLVPAGDRRLVDALLGHGFRVRSTLAYLAGGGGTAPPPGYVCCSRQLA